ncbi:coiled-coil domain-containing protein 25-like, partial [Aphelocoma coerulescens]|uniref:coiled-coil domain-containing protein 25-like n=1 Tax=Aphelocoma coerulescens TaxID=39617 RepID=UPI003604DF30
VHSLTVLSPFPHSPIPPFPHSRIPAPGALADGAVPIPPFPHSHSHIPIPIPPFPHSHIPAFPPQVRSLTVERKASEQLRRLERTRVERFPDLAAERECRDREERGRRRAQLQELRRAERDELRRKKELEELRSYSSLMKAENMSSNQDGNDSDDFM